MSDETVCVSLTAKEALVLFEFLTRIGQNGEVRIQDEAERAVLDDLLCMLEKQLSAPFAPNYAELLEKARQSLRRSEA